MSEKITGIILNVRKYNDRNNIVTIFTRERGRLTFISPTGSGKVSNLRRARIQPLSVISTDLNYKSGVDMQRLGSISSVEVWTDLYFHSVKRAITIFLSEFLNKLLGASMPDEPLFDFIVESLRIFDQLKDGISDFHIPFLIQLLTYSGIQPDLSNYHEGYLFDFAAGGFVMESEAKGPVIKAADAKGILFVMRINFRNMKSLRLNSMNRRHILYGLLNYYSYHFPGLGALKSPEILREIFE